MKKRRKTLLTIAAVIGSLCLSTGAVCLNSELAARVEEETQVQQQTEQESNQELEQSLQNAEISQLEHASVNPDESIQSYITALFENGESRTEADLQALLDIVKFWEDTNDDIQIVGSIYERRPRAESLAVRSTNRPWIESAYNDITGRDDILSVEDVKAYLETGLSYEDIIAASRLSLRGEITTNQALDRVNEGETWYSLVTGESASIAVSEEVSAGELLDARNIAEARSIAFNTVLERLQAGESLEAIERETFEENVEENITEEIETTEPAGRLESTGPAAPANEGEGGEAE